MNRIQSPLTMTKHAPIVAAMFAFVLVFAGLANADAMSSAHPHKGKKGTMTITTPTEVGGLILQPGDYQVREVNSPSGPAVEFVHLWTDYTVGDSGPSLYNQEVVGQVAVTEKALSSLPRHTQLILASDTAEAASLQIRGSAVGYDFPTSQMAGAAREHPASMSTNVGQQQ